MINLLVVSQDLNVDLFISVDCPGYRVLQNLRMRELGASQVYKQQSYYLCSSYKALLSTSVVGMVQTL